MSTILNPQMPRQHIYAPRMDAKTRKHFAKWTRDELIAHVLSYIAELTSAQAELQEAKSARHQLNEALLQEQKKQRANEVYPALPRTYEAQEGLGLSLLTGNAELALQDLEFAVARVRGYLKRIKEKL